MSLGGSKNRINKMVCIECNIIRMCVLESHVCVTQESPAHTHTRIANIELIPSLCYAIYVRLSPNPKHVYVWLKLIAFHIYSVAI